MIKPLIKVIRIAITRGYYIASSLDVEVSTRFTTWVDL
jgi:hypothetical protein